MPRTILLKTIDVKRVHRTRRLNVDFFSSGEMAVTAHRTATIEEDDKITNRDVLEPVQLEHAKLPQGFRDGMVQLEAAIDAAEETRETAEGTGTTR